MGCCLTAKSQSLIDQSKSLHFQAEYEKCISLLEKYRDDVKSTPNLQKLMLLKADCHLKKVEPEKYFKTVQAYFQLQKNFSKQDSLIYLFHKAHYYHYRLEADSSVYLAEQSMKIYDKVKPQLSDSLKVKFLIVYANCMRNKREQKGNRWKKGMPLSYQRRRSIAALQKALELNTDAHKHRIYRVLGTVYNGLIHFFKRRDTIIPEKTMENLLQTGLGYYFKALDIRERKVANDQLFRSQVMSLIGLTYQYDEQYDNANSYYEKAVAAALKAEKVEHIKAYFSAISWKGWNWYEKYKVTGNINYVKKSVQTYENGVQQCLNYFERKGTSTEGIHDGYRFSILHKIPNSLFYLYQETKDHAFIDKALYYADLDSYLTYRDRRKVKDSITVSSLQEVMKPEETLVIYLSSVNPNKVMAIIIKKQDVDFIAVNDLRFNVRAAALNKLTGKKGITAFKRKAYGFYRSVFKPVEPHLQKGTDLIIITPSTFAGLNFELLISERAKGVEKWKDLPYLFHKFNISYGMNPSIFRDNYAVREKRKKGIGVLQDHFSKKTNLLFARQLSDELHEKYGAECHKSIKRKNFIHEIDKSNVFMTIGHGKGSLHASTNTIAINDTTIIKAEDFYNEQLNTDLFITSACKTNVAKTYFSEGLTGGFSKALQYSGVRSTITTNWEIDDKTSTYILSRFFKYLKNGKKRSRALWLAKKDYWNHFEHDALFQPFYWSSFQLTGKTSTVQLTENKGRSKLYWLLMLIPVALLYLLIRKHLKFTERRQ